MGAAVLFFNICVFACFLYVNGLRGECVVVGLSDSSVQKRGGGYELDKNAHRQGHPSPI